MIHYIAAALAAGVAYILLPYLKSRLGAARYDLLCRWVAAAVQAAEQVFAGAGMGAEKKAYARALLEQTGIKNAARYRAKSLPAAGAIVRGEDAEEAQITFET